jgi:NAD(P)-dependent dehydrogenase (short-subunit alcohol dehydrogenase family)
MYLVGSDVSGKSALITGGTSGIGAAIANGCFEGTVVFLWSPAATFITGIILPVDGGYLLS